MKKFERALLPQFDGLNIECYVNDIYQVLVAREEHANDLVHSPALKDRCTYISIKRKDKKSTHDWRHFQQIKNELVGSEVEAIEIYPAESRLHDSANQYHLFCYPVGFKIPFGWTERLVDYTEKKGGWHKGLGQRGLE